MADPCTAPTNCSPTSWAKDIAPMFTAMDVDHMKRKTHNALDLSNAKSVQIWASEICRRVSSGGPGGMPPPSSGEKQWTPQMVNTFACWIQQGFPP